MSSASLNKKRPSVRVDTSHGAGSLQKARGLPTTPGSPVPMSPCSPVMHSLLVCNSDKNFMAPPKPTKEVKDMSFFRGWAMPLLLVVVCTFLSSLIPFVVNNCDGSLIKTLQEFTTFEHMLSQFPRPSWTGVAIFFGWMIFQGILLEFLPGETIYGPPTPTGEKPAYRDNGIKAWIITHGLYVILGAPGLQLINFGALYDNWGEFMATSNVLAMVLTVFFYWKGKNFPSSSDAVWTDKPVFDFFQGTELHPRVCGVNVKQLLNCRYSMMGWSVVHLCFAEAQYNRGELSTGMIVCAALHISYLLKFFWWEAGYFRSIDIIHDRCGYYIVWGVVSWVPTCYCAPVLALVANPAHWPLWMAATVLLVGLAALYVNYDADHQRMHFREKHGKVSVWGKPAQWIDAKYTTGDGEMRTSLLLHSGYWGISRHFHYIPELTLAFCWSLPAIWSTLALPWIYFTFLFVLLVDRSMRDDDKCTKKYGEYWKAYCKKVPYKIFPGIF